MSNFVDATVSDIDSRLKELQGEVVRLQAARDALVGEAKRGPGRPRGSANVAKAAPVRRRARAAGTRAAGAPRARGRRGGNTRSAQALELVRKEPGITIPKIAESLKIEPNYLYRVMPKLVSDGLISRDGLGYHPVASSAG